MKSNKLLSFTFLCFYAGVVLANPVCSRTGAMTMCGEGTLSDLHVAGKATLEGTNVLGQTHISGMLNAENVRLNDLHVAGKASFDASHIKGPVKVSGMLDACHTKFYQKLTLSSNRIHLSHSYAADIQVNPGGRDTQVLCLGHHTTVNGSVVFTSNRGILAIDSTSKITGRVQGGDVSQKDFNTYCEGDETC